MSAAQTWMNPGNAAAPLQIADLAINLLVAWAITFGLGLHYARFGASMGNRHVLGKVFPFVSVTTVLLIAIVKSSLALSLGLVGALSIIRFRTPIKEPEELAYLFLSITIGLGLGADYRMETTAATAIIVSLMTLVQLRVHRSEGRHLYLNIGLEMAAGEPASQALQPVALILHKHCKAVDLRRMDSEQARLELTFFVDIDTSGKIASLSAELTQAFPNVRLTLLDQGRMPSL